MKLWGKTKPKPLVSIIIPVYNVEDYLRESLDGIVNQAYKNLEILCIDDGSTDSSPEILAEYASRDGRIHVIHQENGGVATARNAGLDHASGKYISFLDADDVFELSLFEDVVPHALKTMSDICVYQSDNFSDDFNDRNFNGHAFNEPLIPDKKVFSLRDVPRHAFSVFHGAPWDKLFLADFIKRKQLRFHNTKAASDARFVHFALAVADRISVVPKVLVHYRAYRGGALTKHRDYQSFFRSYMGLREDLIGAGLFDRFEQSYTNRVLHTGLWYLVGKDNIVNEKFYTLLQDGWLEELGLADKDESYFMSADNYRRLEQIKCMSYNEFSKNVVLEEGSR